MSALTLTIIRLAFLGLLWVFVFAALGVLRSDLRAPTMGGRAPVRPAAQRRPESNGKTRGRSSKAPKKLVVTQGSLAGTSVPLGDQPISIGRAPDSTIVLDDDYVSHRHARIAPDAQGRWIVDDLGSTNGTYLDRQRITGPTLVANGVPIRIGKTVVELRR
jgi:pSer/pThr/pTyr-binding forkhead associated (FHA) protein